MCRTTYFPCGCISQRNDARDGTNWVYCGRCDCPYDENGEFRKDRAATLRHFVLVPNPEEFAQCPTST